MKTALKWFCYFFVVALVMTWAYGFFLSRVVSFGRIGEGVLALLGRGQMVEVYRLFSTDFQKKHTFQDFQARIDNSGLAEYDTVSWLQEKKGENNDTGYLYGEVRTKRNAIFYVEMEFIQEKDPTYHFSTWRINDLRLRHDPKE